MKVKLLNDGGYGDMSKVRFPATVEAERMCGYYAVNKGELYRIGADAGEFDLMREWAFNHSICEVVDE